MKPRGPLMIEHRLIEKMLIIANKELVNIKNNKTVDSIFIDTLVDFIRIYADRTHHGKEEDILFKELDNKKLNDKDKKGMQELIDEHIAARKIVKELVEAKTKYIEGDSKSINTIIDKLTFLINFYPVHIKKEDKVFFPDTEKYFSNEELDKMLNDFWDFDKKMIHEKYNKLYESLSKKY
ncbi:MAG TPA: hemerythrin domain-containing protein [Spirochaetota bacterium]|nr:hemerythrin domain-containing protein [Spirochaetota bacterium]HPI88929.1 hemerythrin domain-containing protein [Spirochaetota bacterium]HPR46594.1 hemerythrin domain-containing protein [Spirochaetota bacterium]